jgi:hypothetical protein
VAAFGRSRCLLIRFHQDTVKNALRIRLPAAALVGALSALLRRLPFARQWSALDPLLPFKVDAMNGRKARESGLRLKESVVPFVVLGLVENYWTCARSSPK